jgi:hypothetical protein
MSDVEWRSAATAPEHAVVMTKIDDDKGVRNEQALRRDGRMWWSPDGEMYMYYTPTHYRPLTESEDAEWRDKIMKKAAALAAKAI